MSLISFFNIGWRRWRDHGILALFTLIACDPQRPEMLGVSVTIVSPAVTPYPNLENVLAAVAIGMLAGCRTSHMREAVRNFKAVEHRLEFVATVAGVDYYNDSKATNVDATIKALESFPANVHLILGGKDKGSDYSVLNDLLRQRVKCVYTIGAAAAKIESQIAGATEIVSSQTLDNAVRQASQSAAPDDVVLLAPACSSFDQFQNYEHRGRVFKEAVMTLKRRANC